MNNCMNFLDISAGYNFIVPLLNGTCISRFCAISYDDCDSPLWSWSGYTAIKIING
jgi:hypothetical protein